MNQHWNARHLALIAALAGAGSTAVIVASCKTAPNDSRVKEALFQGKTWEQERQEREAAVDQYLTKNPISYDWFMNSPLGVNGVPVVLLLYFMETYPDIWFENGQSKLGFPPHLSDYDDNGVLKPKDQRRILPLGFGWVRDPSPNAPQTSNMFFACGACHTSRVLVDGKMKYFIGGASNEVEPQRYADLLWKTGEKIFGNVDSLLDLADDAPFKKKVHFRVEKLLAKFNAAQILADLKKDHLKLKLRRHLSKLPRVFSKNQDKYKSQMDDLNLEAELAIITNPKVFGEIMRNFASSYVKANLMYYEIGTKLAFRPANPADPDPEGRKAPPPATGPKPGQMDAFGLVQGIVALNALRPDSSWWEFVEKRYGADSRLFQGASGEGDEKFKNATKLLAGNVFGLLTQMQQTPEQKQRDLDIVKTWFSPNAANIDIKPLWLSRDEYYANWDGNQAAPARALASGVSSVGDPRKVDTKVHSVMNPFIDDLPAPAYPFKVDLEKAARGKVLFEEGKRVPGERSCKSCHYPKNKTIYDVGTDKNRALVTGDVAREAVISLAMEACTLGMERPGENLDRTVDSFLIKRDWCLSKEDGETDIYRKIDVQGKKLKDGSVGYKADVLHGIWASSPYLHNGSVPTIWTLLKPSARPEKFDRGNVHFNEEELGYQYNMKRSEIKYPAGETMNIAPYDTRHRGNSNTGHDTFTVGWTDPEIKDLIEYLKTL